MSAIPEASPQQVMRPVFLTGERPSPTNPPPGCRFHTRCSYVTETCRLQVPALREITSDHFVACHHADELQLKGALEHGKKAQSG